MKLPSFASLRDRLAENARLRIGVAAIMSILALYVVLELGDEAKRARAQTEALQARREALLRYEPGDIWPDRARGVAALVAAYDAQLWREPTMGRAQAAAQDWVTQTLERLKIRPREISVGAAADSPAAVVNGAAAPRATGATGGPPIAQRLRVRVSFEYQRPTLVAFLRALEGAPQGIAVERMSMRAQPTPVAEFDLVALYVPAAVQP